MTTRVAVAATGIALAGALAPPMDRWADHSLTGHMTQHVLLVTVVAPLAALAISSWERASRESVAWERARWAARFVRRHPGPALLGAVPLATVGFAVWHLPAWYDAAAASLPVHVAEHATLLVTALVLWWIVLVAGSDGRAAGLVALFATTLPMTALGLLMSISTSPWYAHYAHGGAASALTDQQVAGVIMWGFGGLATTVGVAALVVGWLHGLDAATAPRAGARRTGAPEVAA